MSEAAQLDIGRAAAATTRGTIGWALYDWANSPFTTLIITFVFSAYFSAGIVGDSARGTELWGYTASVAALLVAIGGPILGSIADAGGPRKPWLLVFTAVCMVGSALLWRCEPAPGSIAWAMIWVVIANVGFEFGVIFNNAMLPDLVPTERIGRWSGWAWGLGYFGGLTALVLALIGFVEADAPWFGLDRQTAEHVRVVGPIVAIWFLLFSWPLFAWTPDRPRLPVTLRQQIGGGLRNLRATLRNARGHANIVRFLIARMIYADGLTTVFAFGGIYAAGTFGMELAEVIKFGIVLNITAGLGAFGFAWFDDRLGSRRTIALALMGLLVTALGTVIVRDITWFWIWGSLLGIFVGPAQAASRSLMARLAPAELRTEFFGLYALTGKATAFVGPLLVALVTRASGSQRWGLSIVLPLFAVGLLLLFTVREPGEARSSRPTPSS